MTKVMRFDCVYLLIQRGLDSQHATLGPCLLQYELLVEQSMGKEALK